MTTPMPSRRFASHGFINASSHLVLPVLCAVVFFILFWYYEKYTLVVSGFFVDAWAYSEMHINYSGGFTRRGLIGHLLTVFHDQTGRTGRTPLAGSFTLIAVLTVILFVVLAFLHAPRRWIAVLVVVCPAAVFFPIYDEAAYLRKETYVLLLLLLLAFFVVFLERTIIYPTRASTIGFYLLVTLGFGFCILIWEPSFVLIFFVVLFILRFESLRNKSNSGRASKGSRYFWTFLSLTPAIILFGLSVRYPGSESRSQINLRDVSSWSGTNPLAILAHGERPDSYARLAWTIWQNFDSAFGYLASFVLGPLLLGALIILFGEKSKWQLGIFAIVPSFSLFFIGIDYGRWIHIQTMSLVTYLLAVNSVIPEIRRFQVAPLVNFNRFLLPTFFVVILVVYLAWWRLPHSGSMPAEYFFGFPPKTVLYVPIS